MEAQGVGALTLFVFAFGIWLGGKLRDRIWREKASGEPRMLSGGELYYVIKDGDIGKAERVLSYCRHA